MVLYFIIFYISFNIQYLYCFLEKVFCTFASGELRQRLQIQPRTLHRKPLFKEILDESQLCQPILKVQKIYRQLSQVSFNVSIVNTASSTILQHIIVSCKLHLQYLFQQLLNLFLNGLNLRRSPENASISNGLESQQSHRYRCRVSFRRREIHECPWFSRCGHPALPFTCSLLEKQGSKLCCQDFHVPQL